MRSCMMLVLPFVGGCEALVDTLQGAVDPTVAVGVVARVDGAAGLPDDVALPDDLLDGLRASFFLADARDVTQLDDAPIAGARLSLRGCGEAVSLTDHGDGSYTAAGEEGPDGCGADDLLVTRDDVDPRARLPVTVPSAHPWSVPAVHAAGEPLAIDLSGAGWDAAILSVVDGETGEVTWSDEPREVGGLYELLRGRQDLSEPVIVPGEAFLPDRLHLVAVTGIVRTRGRDLEHANTVLSTVAGGRTTLAALSTVAP